MPGPAPPSPRDVTAAPPDVTAAAAALAMAARRALHFVFKVGDRARTARFYRELLGMRVSRARRRSGGRGTAQNGRPCGIPVPGVRPGGWGREWSWGLG